LIQLDNTVLTAPSRSDRGFSKLYATLAAHRLLNMSAQRGPSMPCRQVRE